MAPTFLFLFLFLFQVLLLSRPSSAALFREYIGAEFKGVKFSDVPIHSDVDFHFILAFAIDYTAAPSPNNGKFSVFWDNQNLSPEAVAAIKGSHPNVKVMVSLGGDTVSGQPAYFAPSSISSWVDNAVSSLTEIVQQYHLDGIDIDYEHFQADASTFTECIGQLVTRLKSAGVISFASIAPFDDGGDVVQSHYLALWSKYGNSIDCVNFQFYAYNQGTTVEQFLSYFDRQRANYEGGRLLASFSTENNPGGLTPANGFFGACSTLKQQGKLDGIFVWTADTSLSNSFGYEEQAQSLLAA